MNVREWLGENNKIGIDIWEKKYCYNGETFDEWLDRISNKDVNLKRLIQEKKFLPGGRILSSRGLQKFNKKITYSNCYVITPPEDNIESIFDCAKSLARTYSYGGGCGTDISKLSPRGAKINNAAKETSGAVSFMDLYSLVTGLIGQSGRRGALMISIDCNHPDLEDFIDIKSDLNRVTKANIAIKVTNDFMYAVIEDTDFDLTFIREETGEELIKTVQAKEIFRKIAEMNWNYAEPGFLFWDRICHWNLLANTEEFKYVATNPCGEEPLPAGGSCLLGSINLSEFVEGKKFNFSKFEEAVGIGVVSLNNILDEGMSLHPLLEQRESSSQWRQIGLGIFGLADMLIKLELKYGEQKSLDLCNLIGFTMIDTAIATSAYLASISGSFLKCNIEEIINTDFFIKNTTKATAELVKKYGLRNSQLLTVAPTGTLSTMLGVSGGIEPIFTTFYERKTESLHDEDISYKIYTPIIEKYMIKEKIKGIGELPQYFITSQDLDYKERINMQSTWQSHIDAAISSTINLPNNFPINEIENLYLYAYQKGLKGITVYRSGCKREGILTITEEDKKESINVMPSNLIPSISQSNLPRGLVIKTSNNLHGKKRKLQTGCGTMHVETWFDPDNGELREVFFNKGSKGGCERFMQSTSRLASLALRGGVKIEEVLDQLESCPNCSSYVARAKMKRDTSPGTSCATAIAKAILSMQEEMDCEIDDNTITEINLEKAIIVIKQKDTPDKIYGLSLCPDCNFPMETFGGCVTCPECGFSKCD